MMDRLTHNPFCHAFSSLNSFCQKTQMMFSSVSGLPIASTILSFRYIAIYPYTPRKEDELELRKGEMFLVFERCQDGWFKGTSMHTSKIGVFPGNYVAPVTRYIFIQVSK